MARAGKDASAETSSGCETVDPRGGVFPVRVRPGGEREELLEVTEADVFRLDRQATDAPQLDRRAEDETGQTHAADRGREQPGVFIARTNHPCAVAARQFQAQYVAAERSEVLLVFTMHVVGDRATDRHEARAGLHWREPAAVAGIRMTDAAQNVGEPHARFA